jgi:hypothetical protein
LPEKVKVPLGKGQLVRPVKEMILGLWFFRATPSLPGRAMLEIQ